MALTPNAQQKAVLQITQAMLLAAPGKQIMDAFSASATLQSMAAAVVATDLWKIDMGYASRDVSATYTKFIADLVGTTVTSAKQAEMVTTLTTLTGTGTGKMYATVADGIAAFVGLLGDSASTSNADWGTASKMFINKVNVASYYSLDKAMATTTLGNLQAVTASVTSDAATAATAISQMDISFSTTLRLTTGQDNLVGSTLNDLFVGYIADSSNTLQSGDVINGGAGVDRLFADVGNSQKFAITAQTTNVEEVAIRAQATPVDATNGNNTSNNGVTNLNNTVQIDAQRMNSVYRWESNNSRADLIIEDVRIADNAKTKDVTIAMVETDPGNVDFGVYFDQESLRNASSTTSTLKIELMDTGAAGNPATAATPLLHNPYDQFKLGINGVLTTIQLDKVEVAKADTYDKLLVVFQAALAGTAVTASLGPDFTVIDPISRTEVVGKQILLTANTNDSITTPAGSGWYNTTGASVPPTSNIYTTYGAADSSVTELVTSTIILDDVGRGSTGGDLVVGGLSVGATSNSRGVERFEITVEDNSKLQTINSTNDALREVTIKNGLTTNTTANSGVYDPTVQNAGNLTVNGNANIMNAVSGQTTQGTASDSPLAGLDATHHGAYGFTNVRLIDGSAMTGKLEFTAQVTEAAIPKYITRVDTAANPYADVAGAGNVNFNVMGANFIYSGGAANDTMVVDIDASVAASRSRAVSGQSDFTFSVSGGEGADKITIDVIDTNPQSLVGGGENWAANQDLNDNISINAGGGDDVVRIPGTGDTKIDLGAGNDTVYTDNTGRQAVAAINGALGIADGTTTSTGRWIFNSYDHQATGIATTGARNINDIRSDANNSYNLYKATLVVTFKGIPSATITLADTATYKTTDLQINQAIKNAINTDATLSKLLIAEDGPANSLIVTSLIDGAMATTDLTVALAAPVATTVFSAAEIAGMATAYGDATITTSALALAAQTVSYNAYVAAHDYDTAMVQDAAGANITGAASFTTSDNFITPGTGNDVIVLGTTVGADTSRSSNEVVKLEANFGNDVILNFAVAGPGVDHLNLGAFLSSATTATTTGALITGADLVSVVPLVATVNDTDALVSAIIKAADTTATQTGNKQVYVVYNGHNVGKIYSIVNGTAVGDATATYQGTLDLADTNWTTLTDTNYRNVSATAEGASQFGAVPPGPVVNPNLDTQTGAINLAGGAYALTDSDTIANDVVLSGFDANDSITITGTATLSNYNAAGVITSNTTTGDVTINYVNGAVANKIVVSGVAVGQSITTVAQFNALPVGDLNVQADPPGPVYTNLTIDVGTAAAQSTVDASAANYNLTDAVTVENNVKVTGYTSNDKITVTGATSAQYDTAISSDAAGDVFIAFNNGGVLNSVQIVGIAVGTLVYDVASFNALPVGDIFFA